MTSWTYFPELLLTPVPRYTSYPTAAEFSDRVGARELGSALTASLFDVYRQPAARRFSSAI